MPEGRAPDRDWSGPPTRLAGTRRCRGCASPLPRVAGAAAPGCAAPLASTLRRPPRTVRSDRARWRDSRPRAASSDPALELGRRTESHRRKIPLGKARSLRSPNRARRRHRRLTARGRGRSAQRRSDARRRARAMRFPVQAEASKSRGISGTSRPSCRSSANRFRDSRPWRSGDGTPCRNLWSR